MEITLSNVIKNNCSIIKLYDNGTVFEYTKKSEFFESIIASFNHLVCLGREEPAYCVSLHKETIEQLNFGLWIEFEFDNHQIYNDLPFDSLLINVDSNNYGFNIIRKWEGEYYGRCFYIGHITDGMKYFYDAIKIYIK